FYGGESFAGNQTEAGRFIDISLSRARLAVALSGLPEKQRGVIGDYFFKELTFQEIADNSGESVNTVKSRQRRGLEALKRKIFDK
ncbi:sigma-70 family RNA polymerase sigma factor, partial [Candidatus Falkowbacteria bacterium]|nr:sigma-70 family RNA polymerase sigma factor [Candidatus Falkowbacteria bacterium]